MIYKKGYVKNMTLTEFRYETNRIFNKLKIKCEICGNNKKLHIHHIKYRFPIKRGDIAILCTTCHHQLHKNWLIKKPDISSIFNNKNLKRSEKVKEIARVRKITERGARKIVEKYEK